MASTSSNENVGNQAKKGVGEKKPHVVVAGMGPGGLTAALEAYKKGYKVSIYDNRDHFTRTQFVKLNQNILNFLIKISFKPKENVLIQERKVLEDQAFINRLTYEFKNNKHNELTIPLFKLQDFIFKRLPEEIEIRKGNEYEIAGFKLEDPQKNSIKVKTKRKDKNKNNDKDKVKEESIEENIDFDYFVAADGAKRTMATLLNEELSKVDKEKQIKYKLLEIQTRQTPHGTALLRTKAGKKIELKKRRVLTNEDATRFNYLGWDKPVPPLGYVFHDLENQHFFVAGEISQKILEEKEPAKTKMLVEWSKLMIELQHEYKDTDEALELDLLDPKHPLAEEVNKLKTTAFEVLLEYTDTPCIQLNQKAFFVSIGDAALNANFHESQGTIFAIEDGIDFAKSLPDLTNTAVAKPADSANTPMMESQKKNNGTKFASEDFIKARIHRQNQLVNKMGETYSTLQEQYKKEFLPKITKNEIAKAENLLALAKPLKKLDKKFNKKFDEFANTIKKMRKEGKNLFLENKKPNKITLDDYYNKSLEFSVAINDLIAQQNEKEREREREKNRLQREKDHILGEVKELKRIQDELTQWSSSNLSALGNAFKERTEQWRKQRLTYEGHLKDIDKEFKAIEDKKVSIDMAPLQKASKNILTETPLFYRNVEQLRNSSRYDKSKPRESPRETPKKPTGLK